MGSRVSCKNDTDESSNSTSQSSTNEVLMNNIPNSIYKKKSNENVYIKDQFQLEFLDCDCCCDTTKKIANCDFQDIHILQDLYEMVVTPEYKLNCRCSCGDDNNDKKQTIKFGLTAFPSANLTCDHMDHSSSSS
ncbi:hypothetical protein I4U23_019201 [Adineta vaga]|nr:hypothetical protein I4U23_019201 [Adineta vaga]